MSTALQKVDHETKEMQLPQVLQLGEVLYKSGYFSDIKSAAQAVVKVLRGQELGLGPVTALEQIHVLQGKTALSAGLIGALIKRSGKYDYRVTKLSDEVCEIVFFENGKEIGRSEFTLKDAERAGLLKKDTWKQYPRNLLFARALSNGARWYCPEVFGGAVYTPEELQVIDVEAVEISQPEDRPNEPPGEEAKPLTEKQQKKIFALAREKGLAPEDAKAIMSARYGKDSTSDLTAREGSDFIDYLNNLAGKETVASIDRMADIHGIPQPDVHRLIAKKYGVAKATLLTKEQAADFANYLAQDTSQILADLNAIANEEAAGEA